jgi:hypothetical protein
VATQVRHAPRILDAESGVRARVDVGSTTFWVLREMGVFGAGVPTLHEIRDAGQRTVEELVDRTTPMAWQGSSETKGQPLCLPSASPSDPLTNNSRRRHSRSATWFVPVRVC